MSSSAKRQKKNDDDCDGKQIKIEDNDDYEESNLVETFSCSNWDVKEEKMFKIEEDDFPSNPINKRKGKPVKLQNLGTCSSPKEVYDNSAEFAEPPRFLTRNIRQKKERIRRNAEKMRKKQQTLNRTSPNYVFKTELFRLKLWSSLQEPRNSFTSSYLAESYTVFVFQDNQVTVKDNWISMVKDTVDTPECKTMFCDKTIELDNGTMKKIKMVFFVVQARKNLYKGETSRITKKEDSESNQANYESVYRYGAIKLYDTEARVTRLYSRILVVRLVDKDLGPRYLEIFGTGRPSVGWMKNVEHLNWLNEANELGKYPEVPHLILLNDLITNYDEDRASQFSLDARILGYNIHFKKVVSWARDIKMTKVTSMSPVESYNVFVYNDGRLFVQKNSPSIVDTLKYMASHCNQMVVLDKEKQEKVKSIFLVVRSELRKNRFPGNSKTVLIDAGKAVRYGTKLLYDKDTNVNKLNEGRRQYIVLVNEEDHPDYLDIFGKDHPSVKWMKNIDNLQTIHRANQEVKYSHLPRLFLTIDVPGIESATKKKFSSSAEVDGVLLKPATSVRQDTEVSNR